MRKLLKNPLLICLLLLIGFYFLSSVIDAGKELNSIPMFGWCFWGLFIFVVIFFFVFPLCEFFCLPVWSDISNIADETKRNKFLKRYAKYILKRFRKTKIPDEIRDDIELLRLELKLKKSDMKKVECLVTNIRENLSETVVRKIIHNYMKQAALIVVVSPKGWLDSLALFLLQIKMIKILAYNLGFRPSGVFLLCCCTWCLSNSIIASLLDDINLGENITALIGEISGKKIISSIPGISWLTGSLIQLLYAVTAVYSTGIVMKEYLMGIARRRSAKELLMLRANGIKECKSILIDLFKKE